MKTFVCFLLLVVANCEGLTKKEVVDKEATFETDTTLDISDFVRANRIVETEAAGIPVAEDPTLSAGRVEGDMAVDDIKRFVNDSNRIERVAVRSSWRRWPDGEIPYVLSSRYGTYSKAIIAKAMDQYHKKSCIRFVPRDSAVHRDYIYILPDDGCYSLVGKTGGRQPVSLDLGCIQTGTVMHELLHAVGFFHEQSRNDRDDHIDIRWSNVMKEAKDQFEKYSLRIISHLDLPYDYGSLMHYGEFSFTKNGRRTIVPKRSTSARLGQRRGFSDLDLQKLNKLYDCPAKTTETGSGAKPKGNKKLTTTRNKNKQCKNNNWRCSYWSLSAFNYCKKYKDVRETICPKACGTCGQGRQKPRPTTTTKTPERTTAKAESTNDDDDDDESASTSSSCRDLNPSCGRWARKGHCRRKGYKGFMVDTCKKSCKLCPSTTATATTRQPQPSEDNNSDCKDTKRYATVCRVAKVLKRCESQRNRTKLRTHCRKTCKFC